MQVSAAEGLMRNSPVKATKGRSGPTSPTKKARMLERQNPAKVVTRAVPRSPSKGPHTPALHEAATVFSRASAHSPGVRTSGPTVSPKGMDEVQDGKWCEPRRFSCCWAIHQGVRLRYPSTASIWSFVASRCRAMYLCNVEAPNSKATHEQTCISALAKLCAKTVPAISLRALQLASSLPLLTQVPISLIPQSSPLSSKLMCMHGAGTVRPGLSPKYDCNHKQQPKRLLLFSETKEMNAWQVPPPGKRGA